MVDVPTQYQALINEMSASTGLPVSVVTQQAYLESGFNATARSSAGALGWLQFLPSTYQGVAAQAGVSPTSEFDPASEAKAYDVFMGQLLQQYKGNIRNALAAYNAGPGDLAAGYGYADQILGAAGVASNATSGQQAQTTSALGGLGSLFGGGLSISGILGNLVGDMRDILERLGLILLGAALLLLGIHLLSGGTTSNVSGAGTTTVKVDEEKPKASTGKAEKEAGGLAKGTGASEAVEAAAVA